MRAVLNQWDAALHERLAGLEQEGLLRELRPVEGAAAPRLFRDGRELLNLSSNNYLGLAGHPALTEAARAAVARGAGSTSSRLIVGSDPAIAALEERVALFKSCEAALVFPSGYTANIGVLSALLSRDDAVFSDRLNHASVWDGIRLSGATLYRYRHADPNSLAAMLERAQGRHRRMLIVTETVFSMDGDVAPLVEIAGLAEQHGAALMVDEAHAAGVLGPAGTGCATEAGIADRVDLHMGTFSKAFGVQGAYVAGRRGWIDYLVNTCRPFIYTTAPAPAVVGAIGAALDLVIAADDLRVRLLESAARFRRGLAALGLDTCGSTTQIVPALAGPSERAVALAAALERHAVLAVAIRPPTVPTGTARLRFSLTAGHDRADVEEALGAVARALAEVPP